MIITVDTMRDKLMTLDQVHDRLAVTEPLHIEPFSVGDQIRFSASDSATHGMQARDPDEEVPVYVSLGPAVASRSYALSRSTLEDLCATIGFKRPYVTDCPATLLVPHLNYWFREGLAGKRSKRDFQLVINDGLATAFTKQGLTPFSNLALLDQALGVIYERYGHDAEVLTDYKFNHNLRQTTMRLIVPAASRTMVATGTNDDDWSAGIQIKNSLTGQSQTSFEGYLFRWVCTNGQIDSHTATGAYTRRKDATEAEVHDWARTSVNEALNGLQGAFDAVQRLTSLGVEGNLSDALRDIFEHYRVSLQHRPKIIRLIEQYEGEMTMYVIMNAITQVANDPGLEPATVESLLRIGGDFPHTIENRCSACHRIDHRH